MFLSGTLLFGVRVVVGRHGTDIIDEQLRGKDHQHSFWLARYIPLDLLPPPRISTSPAYLSRLSPNEIATFSDLLDFSRDDSLLHPVHSRAPLSAGLESLDDQWMFSYRCDLRGGIDIAA